MGSHQNESLFQYLYPVYKCTVISNIIQLDRLFADERGNQCQTMISANNYEKSITAEE